MTRKEKIAIRAKRIAARDIRMAQRRGEVPKEPVKPVKEHVEPVKEPIKDKWADARAIQAKKVAEAKAILEKEPLKDKLTIEICIHCYHYQHRLCWMLSSILQQKGDVPNIIVNISYAPNNGDPITEEVCKFFREQGLNIKETVVLEKEASNRAIARNKQVAETTADWILFSDSDMVYDPELFSDLQQQLKTNLRTETRVMGGDRHSMDINFCVKFFEEDATVYPCVIPNVADITSKWPLRWVTGKGTAPGNFQLANVKAIQIIRGGKYTERTGDVWRRTKSDRAFRVGQGGRVRIEIKKQFHLNHDRGGPEIQR